MKARTVTDTCPPVFVAALFIIIKRWKPRKCPLTDEWINNEVLFRHKKE